MRRTESEARRDALTGEGMKGANTLPRSFAYAFQGIRTSASERNFKVQCVGTAFALAMCFILRVPAWGWAAVLICIGMVLAAESVNTAVESVVDLASPDLHPLAKRAKDCAAGAVLILAFVSVIVGCIVFIPPAFALLGVA